MGCDLLPGRIKKPTASIFAQPLWGEQIKWNSKALNYQDVQLSINLNLVDNFSLTPFLP